MSWLELETSDVNNVLLRKATYNSIANQLNSMRQTADHQSIYGKDLVYCQNGSGKDVLQYQVVGLGDPVVVPGDLPEDDEYNNNNIFEVALTDADSKKIGIAQDAMASGVGSDGDSALVKVTGVTSAIVTVSDVDHEYAKPTGTAFELESTNESTNIRILYAPAAGPDVVCKVLLGSGSGGGVSITYATMLEDIGPGETADALNKEDGESVTVVFTGWISQEIISSGKKIAYTTVDGIPNTIILAECEDGGDPPQQGDETTPPIPVPP